ncbi:MAG: hypothetical protein BWZ10_01413 [candidate division BRC1 bacterium ADurb.BinA364]|nr:MAG: hypothetical protein BWZ10_01413 [candidate division BRC1 bacterium ADurb.BinA364]
MNSSGRLSPLARIQPSHDVVYVPWSWPSVGGAPPYSATHERIQNPISSKKTLEACSSEGERSIGAEIMAGPFGQVGALKQGEELRAIFFSAGFR